MMKKQLPKDLVLAQKAVAARKRHLRTDNVRDLNAWIRCYKRAEIEATKLGDLDAAKIHRENASRFNALKRTIH